MRRADRSGALRRRRIRPSNRPMSATSASIAFSISGASAGERLDRHRQPSAGRASTPRCRHSARRRRSTGARCRRPGLTRFSNSGADREAAVDVAEVVVVEGAQHPDHRRARCPRRAARALRARRAGSSSAAMRSNAEPGVAQRQARPARQVALVGRARSRAGSGARARPASRRAAARSSSPSQSAVRTRQVWPPRSGPRQSSPSSVASSHRWTLNSFAVSKPARSSRSAELRARQGPSSSTASWRSVSARSWPRRSSPKSVSRLRDQRTIVGANSGTHPAGVLGRDQVDRLAHHPGPQQRALLGPRAVDVGGGEARARGRGRRASPRAAPAPGPGPPRADDVDAGGGSPAGRCSRCEARCAASRRRARGGHGGQAASIALPSRRLTRASPPTFRWP